MEKLHGHPFFVNLFYTFQDSFHLCTNISFESSLCNELCKTRRIVDLRGFNNETTQFYTSEIVSAIEYMHSICIIHRLDSDLKPENILLNENYHIMITDFGTSKFLDPSSQTFDNNLTIDSSFVGTCQYVSPELLIGKKICKRHYFLLNSVLIYGRLRSNPYDRLGDSHTGGYPSLKSHLFFEGVDWDRLTERQPPIQIKLCTLELLPTISN
ncbi:hypothetical protein MXB_4606 [Myxobolus squamalis]|nr:hypothetical protein MXB_4606 [Myxobolus squamalis]